MTRPVLCSSGFNRAVPLTLPQICSCMEVSCILWRAGSLTVRGSTRSCPQDAGRATNFSLSLSPSISLSLSPPKHTLAYITGLPAGSRPLSPHGGNLDAAGGIPMVDSMRPIRRTSPRVRDPGGYPLVDGVRTSSMVNSTPVKAAVRKQIPLPAEVFQSKMQTWAKRRCRWTVNNVNW